MTRLGYRTLMVLCCWLLVLGTVTAVAMQGARVWLDPQVLQVAQGDTTTLDIRVEGVTGLAGAEVHLAFDPALVEVVDADPSTEGVQIAHGGFLSPDFVVQNRADASKGTVDYAIACMPLDKAVSGSGVLARITFRGLAKGESTVTISSVLLADRDGGTIVAETGSARVMVSSSVTSSLMAWVWIGPAVVIVAVVIFMASRKFVFAHYQKGGRE